MGENCRHFSSFSIMDGEADIWHRSEPASRWMACCHACTKFDLFTRNIWTQVFPFKVMQWMHIWMHVYITCRDCMWMKMHYAQAFSIVSAGALKQSDSCQIVVFLCCHLVFDFSAYCHSFSLKECMLLLRLMLKFCLDTHDWNSSRADGMVYSDDYNQREHNV